MEKNFKDLFGHKQGFWKEIITLHRWTEGYYVDSKKVGIWNIFCITIEDNPEYSPNNNFYQEERIVKEKRTEILYI